MKITYLNYFQCSTGSFEPLSPKLTQRFWDVLSLVRPEFSWDTLDGEYRLEYPKNVKPVTMNGHRFDFNFLSFNKRWGSISCYWVSSDKKFLVRLSDHWSSGSRFGTNCRRIRNCLWRLRKSKAKGEFPWLINYEFIEGGIIAFNKLKENLL